MSSPSPFRSLLWYSIPFFLRNFLPLISLPIVTRYLSIVDFGLYALSIVYGTFVSGIANLGLFTVFERTFFEIDISKRKNLLFTNIVFVFCVMFLFGLFTWKYNLSIGEIFFNNSHIAPLLILAYTFVSIKTLNQYFFYYLKNDEKPKHYAIITVSETILSTTISIFFLVFYKSGVEGFLWGQIIGVFFIFFINLLILHYFGKRVFEFNLIKSQLKLSLPLTPRIFFGLINAQFDKYMLGFLDSATGVGLYDIAQKISNTSYSFMTTLQNVFAPQVYKRMFSNDENYKKSIGPYLTPFFYLTILFSLMVGLFAEEILFLFTPQEYHEASLYVTILVVQIAFYFFGKQPQLIYAKKTALISILSFLSITINITLNIPLINFYGVQGAIWATFISGITSSLIYYYYAQKHMPINFERKLFIILFYFVLSSGVLIILLYLDKGYVTRLSFKFAVILGYFFIGVRLKYVKKILTLLSVFFNKNIQKN